MQIQDRPMQTEVIWDHEHHINDIIINQSLYVA